MMAENKKSFLLYRDILPMVSKMPDDAAGKLFKHILEYVNDCNPDEPTDILVSIAFEPIKQQLKRDLEKYKTIVIRNKANGKKGGRPKGSGNEVNPDNPVGLPDNPNEPRKADTDTDTDTDTDKDTDKDKRKSIVKETKKRAAFATPSEVEIIGYSHLKNLNSTGFFDYYESNGWMVGKNKMKNWQAALSGWSKRQVNFSGSLPERPKGGRKPSPGFLRDHPEAERNIIEADFTRLKT